MVYTYINTMCWSKEVSVTSFILAMAGVIYLYYRNNENDRWVALFAGTVALIQLVEYFMWSDQQCGTTNRIASMLALFIIALEPLTNMIGGLYLSNSPNKNLLRIMLLSYVVFIIYTYFTQIRGEQIDWCGISTCKVSGETGNGCHLQWNFLNNMAYSSAIIWTMFLVLPFITMTPRYQGIILIIFGIASRLFASITDNAVVASMWCWYAIGTAFIKIIIG